LPCKSHTICASTHHITNCLDMRRVIGSASRTELATKSDNAGHAACPNGCIGIVEVQYCDTLDL